MNVRIFELLFLVCIGCEQRFSINKIEGFIGSKERVQSASERRINSLEQLTRDQLIRYLMSERAKAWIHVDSSIIQTIPKSHFESPLICEKVSQFFFHQGRLEKALHFNQKAENLGARHAALYRDKSLIYMMMSQYDLALDYVNKAVEINGGDPEIYLAKGEIYAKLGDSKSALQYLKKAYSSDSARMDIAFLLTEQLTAEHEFDASLGLMDLMIDGDHQSNSVGLMKANVLNITGRLSEAKTLLIELLVGGNSEAGNRLILEYQTSQDYDSIVWVCNELLEIDSVNVAAINQKAEAFELKGYYSSAIQYYQQSIKIDSLNEEAISGLAKVNGKIAYLRKIKERRESVPKIDLVIPAQLKIKN